MAAKSFEFLVEAMDADRRLDVFLAQKMADKHSRAHLQKMIKNGDVSVNGNVASSHYLVKEGEAVIVADREIITKSLLAEEIPLEIVYEDEDCLVVNKPSGMVVHPANGNPDHTLVNAVLFHVKNLKGGSDAIRPGIVHRLDKDTSGLLVVAKNDFAHAKLAEQFKEHSVDRVYNAIVQGVVQHDEGYCNEPVGRAFLNRKKIIVRPTGGKEALTFFKVLKRYKNATWVEIRPQTGRTHQIRVHFAHMGHPVLGDTLYGIPFPAIKRQALHALSIGFEQPHTKKWIALKSDLPLDMQELLRFLESQS